MATSPEPPPPKATPLDISSQEHPLMIALNALAQSVFVSRKRTALLALTAFGATLIAYDHRVHVIGALPYLVLLACPLMHLFMMHGDDGHERGDEAPSELPKLPPANHDNHNV
jgi:hypothetical protein